MHSLSLFNGVSGEKANFFYNLRKGLLSEFIGMKENHSCCYDIFPDILQIVVLIEKNSP